MEDPRVIETQAFHTSTGFKPALPPWRQGLNGGEPGNQTQYCFISQALAMLLRILRAFTVLLFLEPTENYDISAS